MATVSHPLAIAASATHPWDDAVLSAEAEGVALDARVNALATFTEASLEAETELVALTKEIARVVGREEGGGKERPMHNWWRSQVSVIVAHARRLGYDPRALDIRGPGWTP